MNFCNKYCSHESENEPVFKVPTLNFNQASKIRKEAAPAPTKPAPKTNPAKTNPVKTNPPRQPKQEAPKQETLNPPEPTPALKPSLKPIETNTAPKPMKVNLACKRETTNPPPSPYLVSKPSLSNQENIPVKPEAKKTRAKPAPAPQYESTRVTRSQTARAGAGGLQSQTEVQPFGKKRF